VSHDSVFMKFEVILSASNSNPHTVLKTGYAEYCVVSAGFQLFNVGSAKDVVGKFELFDVVCDCTPDNFEVFTSGSPTTYMTHNAAFVNFLTGNDITQHRFYCAGHVKQLDGVGLKLNEKVIIHRFKHVNGEYRVKLALNGNVLTQTLDSFENQKLFFY
jgi:hypothetical protein